VFTVRTAQNPDIKSPRRADWEGVNVVATDDRTVVFTLSQPYALFLENTSLGILPKKLWEKITPEEFPFTTLNTNPVGSGPYDVVSVRENSSGIPVEFTLRAFENGVRVPFITHFVVRFYTDEEGLENALNKGEVRAGSSVNPAAITREVEIHEAIFGRVFGVFLNQNQNTLFAESAVREALNHSLDKKQIIDTVLSGYGSEIEGPLPPLTKDISPKENPESSRVEEAREILRTNGWKEGEDGIFEKTTTVKKKKETVRLAFSLTTSNNPELKQAAELTAETWKKLGAEVTLKFFEQNDLTIEVIRPRKYDALLFGEVVGRNPDLFAFWHSSQKNDPGLNIALYANSDVDKKLEKARTEHDIKLRRKNLEEAADEISEDRGAIFLYAPHFVYLAPREVAGVTFGTIAVPSDRFDSVHEWYLSTERVWPIFMFDIKNLFK
jgi:peptide/nickel transport system substrate-binding protein